MLNYGQGLFEGMKAYRTVNGRVVLFRPDQNAARLADGAVRMSMPPVPRGEPALWGCALRRPPALSDPALRAQPCSWTR